MYKKRSVSKQKIYKQNQFRFNHLLLLLDRHRTGNIWFNPLGPLLIFCKLSLTLHHAWPHAWGNVWILA